MANGTPNIANRVIGGIISLVVAAVLGTVGLAIAQSSLKTQVKTNTETLSERRAAVAAIPVIKRDLKHIKEIMEKDQERNEEQHQKILHAIESLR